MTDLLERRCKYKPPDKWKNEPIEIHVDGGSTDNSCYGAMVIIGHPVNIFTKEIIFANGGCYFAEWQAMLWFGQYISNVKPKAVIAYGDNDAIIRRLHGDIGCRKESDAKLVAEFDSYVPSHTQLEFRWVPRNNNLAGVLLEWGQDGRKFSKKVQELYPYKTFKRTFRRV